MIAPDIINQALGQIREIATKHNYVVGVTVRGDGRVSFVFENMRGYSQHVERCDLTPGADAPSPGEALAKLEREWKETT